MTTLFDNNGAEFNSDRTQVKTDSFYRFCCDYIKEFGEVDFEAVKWAELYRIYKYNNNTQND